MLEAGLRDRIRRRVVGLNPSSLCRSQRRYILSYGALVVDLLGINSYIFRTKEEIKTSLTMSSVKTKSRQEVRSTVNQNKIKFENQYAPH